MTIRLLGSPSSRALVATGISLSIAFSFGLLAIPNTHAAGQSSYVWTDQIVTGSPNWTAIASSADGLRLAAVESGTTTTGDIYSSSDGGTTWTDQKAAGSHYWTSIASSADGTRLAAVDFSCNVYTSTDTGVTWTRQELPGNIPGNTDTATIASSGDGRLLAVACGDAGGPSGGIFTSSDGGTTWTDQKAADFHYWTSIASSADGTHLVAAAMNATTTSKVYTSTNGGATWTGHSIGASYNGILVTSAANGDFLAAAIDDGNIYTSSDGGATWTDQTAAGPIIGLRLHPPPMGCA